MKKIAVIGPIHKDGIRFLENNKFHVFEIIDLSKDNLIKELKEVDGIIVRTSKLTKDILQECSKLKIIARHGVGYDNIDSNYLDQRKIALALTGDSNSVSVAEHVLTMFLYLSKNIYQADKLVKEGNFQQRESFSNFFELYNKNVFILGFGRIGQAVAKRCLGFESKVFFYDPYINNNSFNLDNCKKIDFEEGISLADFITIHMPLTSETTNMIDKNQLLKMKKNCILVNTARGGIINENDLQWALQNNEILGAGLDVFLEEPPIKNHPLFKMKNILLTPHNAALTIECRKRMSIECAENIYYYFKNKPKLNKKNIVNKKVINL